MPNPFKSEPCTFVVDDEVEIAKMLSVILQMNLFDAVPYHCPEDALRDAECNAPDYLISDVVMPCMNGIDLAIKVKAVAPNCKVLLFSGQAGAPELIRRASEAGYDFALVQKPIHPTVLVAALRAL